MFAILVCIIVWCAPIKLEHFQLELAIYNALLGRRRIPWKQLCFSMHKLPLFRRRGRMLRWLAKWTCHGLFRAVWPITWSLRASYWEPEQASIPIKMLFVRSKICSKISRRNLLQYTRFPLAIIAAALKINSFEHLGCKKRPSPPHNLSKFVRSRFKLAAIHYEPRKSVILWCKTENNHFKILKFWFKMMPNI